MRGSELESTRLFEAKKIQQSSSPLISSRTNPLVKLLRALATREGRQEHSLLLLEGTHLLQEALRTFSSPLAIIATVSWLEENPTLLNSIDKKTMLYKVTPDLLGACLTTVKPDGVATLWPLNELPRPESSAKFVLALDRLQDPGNLGTLLRTALAAEVEAVWLASGADPLGPKVLRASAGKK